MIAATAEQKRHAQTKNPWLPPSPDDTGVTGGGHTAMVIASRSFFVLPARGTTVRF